MMKLTHRFVEKIPEALETGVVYVSLKYGVVTHLCPCGCGNEVVTNLSPNGWSLIYDGQTVSLHPSIGNWNFKCRSHYWIRKDRIEWAEDWNTYQRRHQGKQIHGKQTAEPARKRAGMWRFISKLRGK
jgi:hypothetical protein